MNVPAIEDGEVDTFASYRCSSTAIVHDRATVTTDPRMVPPRV
jgi:hypothetical protein